MLIFVYISGGEQRSSSPSKKIIVSFVVLVPLAIGAIGAYVAKRYKMLRPGSRIQPQTRMNPTRPVQAASM